MSGSTPTDSGSRNDRLAVKIGWRVGLVVFGVVAGFVALELALQLGALARRAFTPTRAASGVGDAARRVVAVGDSNTYGIYVDADQAYPLVLQQQWNARHADHPIEVVNLGYPGTNSSVLRNAIADILARLHPQVVTIMVGANDIWTEAVPMGDAGVGKGSFLWRWSRVYRLLYMMRQAARPRFEDTAHVTSEDFDGQAGTMVVDDLPFQFAWRRRTTRNAEWVLELRQNLEWMIAVVRASGAEPVLVTYPAEDRIYGGVNRVLRVEAGSSNARLIDLGAAFHERCPKIDCADLFYPDHHPTAAGHAIAGKLMADGWDGWGPSD